MPAHTNGSGMCSHALFRPATLLALLVLLACLALPPVHAAGQGASACTLGPNPGVVAQPFTMRATGLPTSAPVYVFLAEPNRRDYRYWQFPLHVATDGSWQGSDTADSAGIWAYFFVSPTAHGRYRMVASCAEIVR